MFVLGVMEDAISKPDYGGKHAEPADGAGSRADLLILYEHAPLSEKNRPIALLGAD